MNWSGPAAAKLDELAAALPASPPRRIAVFGSAPLQLQLADEFLSRDVDVFSLDDDDFLSQFVEENGFLATENAFGLQVTDRNVFRSTSDWMARAKEVTRHGHRFFIPHPWDILVGKLQRLEEKDVYAFRLVIRLTGGPTAEEFARHLLGAVDHFRPRFDEEAGGDLVLNTQLLWQKVFQSTIDVRGEIIRPALERIRLGYEAQNRGDASLKTRLEDLSET